MQMQSPSNAGPTQDESDCAAGDNNDIYVKELDFPDLEEEPISLQPFLYFMVMYCFNAIFVLPFFIVSTIIGLFKQIATSLRRCAFLQVIQAIIYYLVDILMAISVLAMYPLTFMPTPTDVINYQYWAISGLIFLQSFLLMQSYMMTISNSELTTFSDLLRLLTSQKNMHQLGLGRLAHKMNNASTRKEIQQHREELEELIKNSLEEENIDSTLFYFTLESDPQIVRVEEFKDLTLHKLHHMVEKARSYLRTQHNMMLSQSGTSTEDHSDRNEILKHIRREGFRGRRHIIDNLLWPHYIYVKTKQHVSLTELILICASILIFKLSFPAYQTVTYSPNQQSYILLGLFGGMYLNMISILIDLILNEDLRGRTYIMKVMETLLTQKSTGGEEDKGGFWGDPDKELPENEKFKLDLGCNLSLESWDNARRLAITFDKQNMEIQETTFSFLSFYCLYAYIILSQDYLGFDLFPTMHKFFSSPIQEWNMLVDFFLISILFLMRVKQGSLYNKTFDRLLAVCESLANLYEDKKTLFEFYFDPQVIFQIKNDNYKNVTHRIFCASAERTLFHYALQHHERLNVESFFKHIEHRSRHKVHQLCHTMEKLTSQIEFDSEHFCHMFLGAFKSDIGKVFSTFLILAYIFFHSKLKKFLKEHKTKGHDLL